MVGYLTPDTIPADTLCRVLFIPNDLDWLAQVTGALQELTFPASWTKFGAVTPEDAAAAMVPMFDQFCFNQGVCRVIGEIIAFAGNTSPDARWLPCDGASLLRADYPDLFTVIGTTYGAPDSTHFNLPDLRNNVAVGAGDLYSPGDQGGEAEHTLTIGESPSHTHTDTGHTHVEGNAIASVAQAPVVPIPSAIPGVGATGIGNASLTSTGGGGAHNNLQPYLAIMYLIVALS